MQESLCSQRILTQETDDLPGFGFIGDKFSQGCFMDLHAAHHYRPLLGSVLVLLNLPFALVGGVLAVFAAGGGMGWW